MLRIVLGVVILLAGIIYSSWWGILGLVLILTGVFNFCALYAIFGISTCETETPKENSTIEMPPSTPTDSSDPFKE